MLDILTLGYSPILISKFLNSNVFQFKDVKKAYLFLLVSCLLLQHRALETAAVCLELLLPAHHKSWGIVVCETKPITLHDVFLILLYSFIVL